MSALKNGLFHENGELIYYKDDRPKHAGAIQIDNDIYYISSHGKAVKGEHVVHRDMANDILKRGTYTFGDDYKLIPGSYIAPKKKKVKKQSKKSKSSNRKNARIKGRLQNMKNKPLLVSMLALALVMIIAISVVEFIRYSDPTHTGSSSGNLFNSKVTLPEFKEDVLLCSQAAKQEYDGKLAMEIAASTGDPYRPFYFEYTFVNCSGTLYLSEHEDLSDAKLYDMPENEHSLIIHNLMVNTTYYYMVTVGRHEYFGSFHTAQAPRFVYIPGLVNTRDIGGGTTQDGKTVKQGLLIRGVEIDGLVRADYFIPTDELETVKDEFGFVYDLDLRATTIYNGQYSSRFEIPHRFYTSPQYGEIFSLTYKSYLRIIISDMADPQKYPMYLHCTLGQDRTGTIVFLLQGILNCSEEDMRREYMLTSYVNPHLSENNIDIIINGLQPYAGDTLQEKIITFLTTEIGVTEAEIESIRSIFLED